MDDSFNIRAKETTMDQEHPNMDIGYVPAFTYIRIVVLLEGRVVGLMRAAEATSG